MERNAPNAVKIRDVAAAPVRPALPKCLGLEAHDLEQRLPALVLISISSDGLLGGALQIDAELVVKPFAGATIQLQPVLDQPQDTTTNLVLVIVECAVVEIDG